jgi:hypothetical protein
MLRIDLSGQLASGPECIEGRTRDVPSRVLAKRSRLGRLDLH